MTESLVKVFAVWLATGTFFTVGFVVCWLLAPWINRAPR